MPFAVGTSMPASVTKLLILSPHAWRTISLLGKPPSLLSSRVFPVPYLGNIIKILQKIGACDRVGRERIQKITLISL